MLDKSLAIFAYLILAGFLGILGFTVLDIDLLIVLAITLALAGWDQFKSV